MFKIKSNNAEIYNLKNEKKYIVENPKLTQELNKSGELSFKIPPTHPNYEEIEGLTSNVKLYNNDILEFAGRVIENKDSFDKKRNIKIEGELSYLCDSLQPASVFRGTPLQFFTRVIETHNSQVEESKRFLVGMFTVTDSNNFIYRYTNYEDTLAVLNEKLVNQLGGYLRVRYANNNRYLDLIADYGSTNSQVIEFGKNILDLERYIKFSNLRTAMIPLGYETNSTVTTGDDAGTIKLRLTLQDYPDGEYGDIVKNGNLIYSKSGVAKYGFIYATKDESLFNDVTLPENLFTKGVAKLNALLESSLTIELNAIDLNLINVNIEKIELGQRIRVLSRPHNLNEYFLVTKIVKDLANPKNNKIYLGNSLKSLTNTINRSNSSLNNNLNKLNYTSTTTLETAKKNATDAINSVQGGYVKLINGELFILDNEDINQAQKIWRWNLNGLGYTQDGKNGTYGLAMTMDGQIVADYITTGTLRSIAIQNGNNFSVDADGNVLISSSSSQKYKYTDLDVMMALNHIQGNITLPTALVNLYNVNGGSFNITDPTLMMNIRNGTADPVKTITNTVSINPNSLNDTILLKVDDTLKTSIGLFQIYSYMMKSTQILVGDGYADSISSISYGIRLDGKNKKLTITDASNSVGTVIDSGKVDAYNVFASSGGSKGYCMHGESDSHTYRCGWEARGNSSSTSNVFQVFVDSSRIPIIKSSDTVGNMISEMILATSYIQFIVPGYGAYGINGVFQSDTKLKENIKDSEINALDFISSLRHIQYDWKDTPLATGTGHEDIGFSANQIKEIDSKIVFEVKQPDGSEFDKVLQINSDRLLPYITKAIQELNNKIDNLRLEKNI